MSTERSATASEEDGCTLLERALKQPGVREFLEVFESWQSTEASAKPYLLAVAQKPILYASNSSVPLDW